MIVSDTLIKTSPALIVLPAEDDLVSAYEFLSKNYAEVSIGALYWFNYFKPGRTFHEALRDHPDFSADELSAELEGIIAENFLHIEGSQVQAAARNFESSWKWDMTSALFHFTVLNNEFVSADESARMQAEKVRRARSPSLQWLNGNEGMALPAPGAAMDLQVLQNMYRRRTNRSSRPLPVNASQLGDCLFAGMGVTGYVQTPIGELPLAMTPSGGARNPFEAYVIVKSASDLATGIHHYSGAEHSLKLLNSELPASIAPLFANQEWIEGSAAIIVLAGIFERTMYKYSDPNAYRVSLIEAGHIGQNIMLAATSMGLTACPTAALAHEQLAKLLGIQGPTQAPVYALSLAYPAPSDDIVRQNPLMSIVPSLLRH